MQTLHSNYQDLGPVMLPTYQGRQKYMHTFDSNAPEMAEGYEDYLDIVSKLCVSVAHTGPAHMTVDEKIVKAGWSQRRPDAHVDGWYNPAQQRWGGGGWGGQRSCVHNEFRMAVIVATSEPGCMVYPGEFVGNPADDGDLEHIRDQFKDAVMLEPNRAYWLSPDCVHESMRFPVDTQRTFLRIALE